MNESKISDKEKTILTTKRLFFENCRYAKRDLATPLDKMGISFP
jgi:hypothetical protein